jgi:acyl carrier protein
MNDLIFQKVKTILITSLGCDEDLVTPDAHIQNDLGADSLDCVELVMELETKFGCEISDEETEKLTTVGKLVDWLEENENQ